MTTRNAASMGTYEATWICRGYRGGGNTEELIDSAEGQPAIVCGGGVGVFEEIRQVSKMIPNSLMFAVNDIGMFLPRLDHWITLHVDNMPAWKSVRWLNPKPTEPKYHGEAWRPWLNYGWDGLNPLFCLSGYFAMQIAYIMGCNPIILCGIPGDDSPRFFDLNKRENFSYSTQGVQDQVINEMERLPEFKKCVKSMSGWTREFFGEFKG